jgi:glycopeptide antibiotics resistance protein
MTAETEGSETGSTAPATVSWGRTVLRILILVVAFVALAAFAVALAELTLTPSPASADIAGSNLRPGHSLRQYAEDYTFLAACKQVGGNIVMGVPFGLILPVLVPRRLRMIRVVLLAAVVMVLVELVQGAVIEGRAFDVDDVIMNTTGALLGYLLLGRRIGRKYHALGVPRVPAKASAPTSAPTSAPASAPVARAGTRSGTRTPTTTRIPSMTKSKTATTRKRTGTKSAAPQSDSPGSSSWSDRLGRLARRR